jgi:hypothetical protein
MLKHTASGVSESVLPLASPVNDVLGLSLDECYLAHLLSSYSEFWIQGGDGTQPAMSRDLRDLDHASSAFQAARRDVDSWLDAEVSVIFTEAVQASEQGRLSAKLAPYIERIVRNPRQQPDEVSDLPTLATWALEELLRRRRVTLHRCRLCRRYWVPPQRNPDAVCRRPQPSRKLSCYEKSRQLEWAIANGDWRREYKKLHERVRAGSLPRELFESWKAENRPESWRPFHVWGAQPQVDGRERGTRERVDPETPK